MAFLLHLLLSTLTCVYVLLQATRQAEGGMDQEEQAHELQGRRIKTTDKCDTH